MHTDTHTDTIITIILIINDTESLSTQRCQLYMLCMHKQFSQVASTFHWNIPEIDGNSRISNRAKYASRHKLAGHAIQYIHCVSKKVPTFKLSVISSNLNHFQNFCAAKKRTKFVTKNAQHYPPYLKYVATLPWEIKNSNFVQESRYGKNANTLHFKCTDYNSSARVTVYAVCIYVFLSKSCPRCWMPCWWLTNTAVTSAVTTFRCHRLIVK